MQDKSTSMFFDYFSLNGSYGIMFTSSQLLLLYKYLKYNSQNKFLKK